VLVQGDHNALMFERLPLTVEYDPTYEFLVVVLRLLSSLQYITNDPLGTDRLQTNNAVVLLPKITGNFTFVAE